MNPFDVPVGIPSIAHAILTHVRERPDAPAILAPGRSPLSYGELWRQIERTVAALREFGIGPSDRVALVLPNGPEMAVALVAAICGAVAAPVNPGLGAAELDVSLSDLRAKAIIIPAGSSSPIREVAAARCLPVIELVPNLDAAAGVFDLIGRKVESPDESHRVELGAELSTELDRLVLVLQTSGTTARSKTFAMNQSRVLEVISERIVMTRLVESDRCLNLSPLFHGQGIFSVILVSLVVGGSVICAPGPLLPDFFDWLDELRPTWYIGVPAMHQAILAEAPHHREIVARVPFRFIRSGSSGLSPSLRIEIESVFNAPVVDRYGLTETRATAYTPLPPARNKVGSVGVSTGPWVVALDDFARPMPPNKIGELAIEESRAVRPESGDLPPNTFTNGWFRTGDLGYIDDERYVFITGRVKELINRGGEKISPQEVEAALLEHPDVAEAVAFAVSHPRLGEGVAAAVVLRAGASVDGRTVRAHAASRLARYKVPQQVLVLPEIPRGPTGKYQRVGMAARLGLTVAEQLIASAQPRDDVAQPRDKTEARLLAVWKSLLGSSSVGVDEDFFALGGDSLLALQLLLRVEQEFGLRFPDSLLYEASTVEELAAVLRSRQTSQELVSTIPLKPSGQYPPLFVCLHVGTVGATTYRHLARQIDSKRPLFGVQSRGVDERGVPKRRLEDIAADYVTKILEAQAAGPYHLCGHSAAGLIAYEVARQLVAQGREVAFLGLFDAACPGFYEPVGEKLGRHIVAIASSTPRELLAYLGPRVVNRCRYTRTTVLRALQRAFPNLPASGRYKSLWISTGTTSAYRDYEPRPYGGRLTMFLASRRPPNYHQTPQLGWREYAVGGLDVRQVSGDHVSLLTGEESRELASVLNACLEDELVLASKAL